MKLIVLLFAISLSSFASGQDDISTKNLACDTTLAYWTVQTLPEYKGGNEKLLRDLNNNLKLGKQINGTCRFDFMVNCKGKTWGYKFDSGFDKKFENKFTETFSELQNWKPGKYKNENVDCSYSLILRIDKGIIKNNE